MNDSSSERLREVGKSVERKDGLAKVTGRAQYLDDLTVPGVVYAALVRSPYAHARIARVDFRAAAAVPGVLGAFGIDELGELGARPFGTYTKDQTVLARGKVRYEGEPVVAVVAEDATTAQRAARLVEIDYQALPPVIECGPTPDTRTSSARSWRTCSGWTWRASA